MHPRGFLLTAWPGSVALAHAHCLSRMLSFSSWEVAVLVLSGRPCSPRSLWECPPQWLAGARFLLPGKGYSTGGVCSQPSQPSQPGASPRPCLPRPSWLSPSCPETPFPLRPTSTGLSAVTRPQHLCHSCLCGLNIHITSVGTSRFRVAQCVCYICGACVRLA